MKNLFEDIRNNRCPTTLDFCNGKITNEQVIELAKYLADNHTIRELLLDSNQLQPSAGIALANALSRNHTMVRLTLRYNRVGDEAVKAFAEMIQRNTTLEELNLSDNLVAEPSGEILRFAITRNNTLKKFFVFGNKLSEETQEIIADKIKLNMEGIEKTKKSSESSVLVVAPIDLAKKAKEKSEGERREQIRKKLLFLNGTLEREGDDSSDEEIDIPLHHPNRYTYNATFLKNNHDAWPTIVRALALSLYRSREVNGLYQVEKSKLLDNTIYLTDEKIDQWVQQGIDQIVSGFFGPLSSPFFTRYLNYLRENFIKTHREEINKITKSLQEFFKVNPRCLFKIAFGRPEINLPWCFYKLIEDFYKIYQAFDWNLSLNGGYEHFQISKTDLEKELTEEYEVETKNSIKKILQDYRLITVSGAFFVGSKERKQNLSIFTTIEPPNTELKKEVLRLVKAAVKTSNYTVDNFLDNFYSQFWEAELKDRIASMESNGLLSAKASSESIHLRSERHQDYRIVRNSKEFASSMFSKLENQFLSEFNARLNMGGMLSYLITGVFDFYQENSTVLLERTTLPTNYNAVNRGILYPLVTVRLFNRSQNRAIKQKSEEAKEIKARICEETVLRSLEFPSISYAASETQQISCNGVRTDLVVNLDNYSKIYLEIKHLKELLSVQDKDIAEWVRSTLRNQPVAAINGFTGARKKQASLLIANLTYILFITETARNPSCWIIHQMMLDLIIQGGLTWYGAFNLENTDRVFMPMAFKGAVEGARQLGDAFYKQGVARYEYPGARDKNMAERIHRAENKLILNWFENCRGKSTKEISEKTLTEEITRAIKIWYEVEINLNFRTDNSSIVYKNQIFSLYKSKLSTYRALKESLTPLIESDSIIEVIAEYCLGKPRM